MWVFLANGFFHCKILLETSILRIQTPYIPRRAVFKVWGGGGGSKFEGGSKFGCSSLWLFRTVRLLDLSVLSHC